MEKIYKIILYKQHNKVPFESWFSEQEIIVQAKIAERIDRLSLGNWGDYKKLKNAKGLWELRLNYGPGYRIYLGKEGGNIVILLVGGTKGTQKKDINTALEYWNSYRREDYDI